MSEVEHVEALKQDIKLVVQRLDTQFEKIGDVVERVEGKEFSDQTLDEIADFVTSLLESVSHIDYSFADEGSQAEIAESVEDLRTSCVYIQEQLSKKDDASFDSVEIVREYDALKEAYDSLKHSLVAAVR